MDIVTGILCTMPNLRICEIISSLPINWASDDWEALGLGQALCDGKKSHPARSSTTSIKVLKQNYPRIQRLFLVGACKGFQYLRVAVGALRGTCAIWAAVSPRK